jgi:hypothetical protein
MKQRQKDEHLWAGKGHVHEFDDFRTNGQTATNSNRKEITDWELTDLIQFVDEYTTTDEGFCNDLVMSLFAHFGWKYYPKK